MSHQNSYYATSSDKMASIMSSLNLNASFNRAGPEMMSNKELKQNVENETKTNRQLFLENDIFERYLRRAEPQLLENLDQQLEHGAAAHNRANIVASRLVIHMVSEPSFHVINKKSTMFEPMHSSPSVAGTSVAAKTSAVASGKSGVQAINTSHKIDMCSKEMEELKASFEHLKKVFSIHSAHLKAESEEIATMLEELRETDEELELKVIAAVDPQTNKVSAQTFIKFMEAWFKQADAVSAKLRLKTSTLKIQYGKLATQLEEKIELGETLRPVDFDFQIILILESSKILAHKNKDLSLLKSDTANTHREFTAFKDQLQEQMSQIKSLKDSIEENNSRLAWLEQETEVAQMEVDRAQRGLNKIVKLRTTYQSPDVREYARVRNEMYFLKKELKTCQRRYELQHNLLLFTIKKYNQRKKI